MPELPGWYLWGKLLSDADSWETMYVGKAGKQKTSSLRTRMYDELREDCLIFWAELYGSEPMLRASSAIYNGKYDTQPRRALNKFGARFVIWISVEDAINDAELRRQEIALMKV
ncbi:MAG: hypothetical protein ACRDTV_06095, partial [Mycobacterium sp.]